METFSHRQNEESVSPTKLCCKTLKGDSQAKGKFYPMETQVYFIVKRHKI